jgi:hypothetical protein
MREHSDEHYISTVTIAEIEAGIARCEPCDLCSEGTEREERYCQKTCPSPPSLFVSC